MSYTCRGNLVFLEIDLNPFFYSQILQIVFYILMSLILIQNLSLFC